MIMYIHFQKARRILIAVIIDFKVIIEIGKIGAKVLNSKGWTKPA